MADISKIKTPDGTTYNIKDETARSDASTKVSKTGDTMTGTLNAASNRYYDANNLSGLDMKNSDIIGVNGYYTADVCEDAREGINFYRDATHWDGLFARYGELYFTPNREKGTAGEKQKVLVQNNRERGTTDISVRPLVDRARANRLAFLPPDQVIIEKTTDGGETWVDAEVSDWNKTCLFSVGAGVYLPLLDGERSTQCGIRITITAMKYNVPDGTTETEKYNYWNSSYVKSQERYCNVREWWFWVSSASDRLTCKIEAATGANSTNWVNFFNDSTFLLTGWSGSDWIRAGGGNTFGGGTTQPTNYWNWRLTFFSAYEPSSGGFTGNSAQFVSTIRCYGDSVWNGGSVGGMALNDHLYTFDGSANAVFPGRVTATDMQAPNLILYGGVDSGLGNGAPASTAQQYYLDGSKVPPGRIKFYLSPSGVEYTLLFSNRHNNYGTILKWGYNNKYIYILRRYNSTWRSSDWEKIDAGNADTVNGHTVNKDVPSDAKFTDTTYTGTSPISINSSNAISIGNASTSAYGATKLSTATNSTATDLAATPSAVKTAYDLANTANTTANTALSGVSGTLIYDHTYSISGGVATFTAHVYCKGQEVTSTYADSCFTWSYRLDSNISGTPSVVSLGTGKTKTITISTLGYGGHVIGSFTPPA